MFINTKQKYETMLNTTNIVYLTTSTCSLSDQITKCFGPCLHLTTCDHHITETALYTR